MGISGQVNFGAETVSDLVINSGAADSIVAAQRTGTPVYGAMMPRSSLELLATTATEPGANANFTGLGRTAIFGEDFMLSNPEAVEMLAKSRPMTPGGIIVRFIPGKGWVVVRAF